MLTVERKRVLLPILVFLLGFVLSAPLTAREAPSLAPDLAGQSITLDFPDKTVAEICDSITESSGLQFIFDDKTNLQKTLHVDLGTMPLDSALDMLMIQSKNFYKPLDERTVLVAPDTRQKRQEYEDQVIQTFHLSNVDSEQVVTLLRSMLQARQVSESRTHNTVTIKDTPDKVGIAAKLVETADRQPGEVIVQIEVLEVAKSGVRSAGDDADAIRNTPGAVSLAHPTLRIVNGRSGSIHIGDAVPLPSPCAAEGGSDEPAAGVTYHNVGIAIDVEPRINDNREVTLMMAIEMSSLIPEKARSVTAGRGPAISRRQLETTMRLADGETHVLSSLPSLNRTVGSSSGDSAKGETEVVLLVTPRVTREPDIGSGEGLPMWVGTEENMKM
jgi:general secretion pathway protein D